MSQNLKGHYAGFVSRLLAYAVDIVIITVTVLAGAALLDAVRSLFQFQPWQSASALPLALAGVVILLYSAGYYAFFWTLTGQTPGKMLLGVRVVTLDGQHLSFWRALIRFGGYFLSALALYAGYWWILFDNRRQGWHDKLAGTCVIYAWDARVGEGFRREFERRQESKQTEQ